MKRLFVLSAATLTLAAAIVATALGSLAVNENLHVVVTGDAGTIHVSGPKGVRSCEIDCVYRWARGTRLTLRAEDAKPVTHFVHWTGACTGTNRTCVIVLRRNLSVKGTFTKNG